MRLHKPAFTPLLPSELPQPGSLFALDAEFVAFSPPEKALQRCGGAVRLPAAAALCAALAPLYVWLGLPLWSQAAVASPLPPCLDGLPACLLAWSSAGGWRWRCGRRGWAWRG